MNRVDGSLDLGLREPERCLLFVLVLHLEHVVLVLLDPGLVPVDGFLVLGDFELVLLENTLVLGDHLLTLGYLGAQLVVEPSQLMDLAVPLLYLYSHFLYSLL